MIEISFTYIDEETAFLCTETEKYDGSLKDAIANMADRIAFGLIKEKVLEVRFRDVTPS